MKTLAEYLQDQGALQSSQAPGAVRQTLDSMNGVAPASPEPPLHFNPMNALIASYTYHHQGHWADVIQAAAVNPVLAQFVQVAEAQMRAQYTTKPVFEFSGRRFDGIGDIVAFIDEETKKSIPGFS